MGITQPQIGTLLTLSPLHVIDLFALQQGFNSFTMAPAPTYCGSPRTRAKGPHIFFLAAFRKGPRAGGT